MNQAPGPDDDIAGAPTISADCDLTHLEFKWQRVKVTVAKLILMVMIVHFDAFAEERVVSNSDPSKA